MGQAISLCFASGGFRKTLIPERVKAFARTSESSSCDDGQRKVLERLRAAPWRVPKPTRSTPLRLRARTPPERTERLP